MTCRKGQISQVLDVLEQMPALQTLKLWFSLPDCGAQLISAAPNQRRVALRSLSQLVIWDSADGVAYLMSHLDLPEGVISHFKLYGCFDLNSEFQDTLIALVIKTYKNLAVDPRPRGLKLIIQPYHIIFKATFGRPGIIYTVSNDCPFIFEFDYNPPHRPRNLCLWSAMISTILSLISIF